MFEIMLLASFVLVTLGQSVEQLRAAIVYVVLNILGSWLLLLGIGMLYKTVGTLNFSHLAMRLNHMENNQTITMISLVFLVAFSSKAALVIFMWLPKAYAVLNTELAALFAALMTKVGAYALIRFYFTIRPSSRHAYIARVYGLYHNDYYLVSSLTKILRKLRLIKLFCLLDSLF